MGKYHISTKLAAAFALLLCILVGFGWLGLHRMAQMNSSMDVFHRRWSKQQVAREAVYYSNQSYRMATQIFLREDSGDSEIQAVIAARVENNRKISEDLTKIGQTLDSPRENELYAKVQAVRNPTTLTILQALKLKETNPAAATQLWINTVLPDVDTLNAAWNDYVQYEDDRMIQARNENEASYARTRRISILLVILGFGLASFIAIYVTLRMIQEIAQRESAKEEVRQLNAQLEKKVADRTEELALANQRLETEIEQRKHNEHRLRQAQKMEAIGRLAGGVAHDFNNSLGVIIGYSELMLDSLPDGAPLRNYTEQIKKAGDRATLLTRQLLAFSRQQVLAPRVLNLSTILADMEKMLPRLIGEDIAIHTSLSSDLGNVKADPGQIEQIIMNLAANARDAMSHGGELIFETKNVDLDEEYARNHSSTMVPGRYVLLVVSDTGSGMDAQTLTHIFEPFFTTKEAGKGTGLGLATVYGVVKQSGGFIYAYSELGLGSTFKVYLPRVDQAIEAVIPSDGAEHDFAPRPQTILLVEDEDSLRCLTKTFLKQSGRAVLEAKNGLEAREIVAKHCGQIDLLLTDMIMPGMNGRALAEVLTRIRPEMRVIYMSGYTGFQQRGLLDSDAVLLSKPFARADLLRKLKEVLTFEPLVG